MANKDLYKRWQSYRLVYFYWRSKHVRECAAL